MTAEDLMNERFWLKLKQETSHALKGITL